MISWAEPAPRRGPEGPVSRYIEALRRVKDNPGQWALIKSGSLASIYNTAAKLKLRVFHVPPGTWEFTVRQFRRGVHVGSRHEVAQLYARFIGDEAQAFPAGAVSVKARFTASGKRACRKCGSVLRRSSNVGPWPIFCESCWQKEPSARRLTAERAARYYARKRGRDVPKRKPGRPRNVAA